MSILLYNRSCYSLLESSLTFRQMTDFCAEQGYRTIGLVDKNVLYGAMEFYHLCKASNIKAVFGMEISVVIDTDHYPFVLFAKNNESYQQLMNICSQIQLNHLQFDLEMLKKYKDVFYIVAVNHKGILEKLYNLNDQKGINHILAVAKDNDFYIGMDPDDSQYHERLNFKIRALNKEIGANLLAFPLAVYSSLDDYEAYTVLKAIGKNTTATDDRLDLEKDGYLRLKDELMNQFTAEEVDHAYSIGNNCNVDMQYEKATLPAFVCPNNADSKLYLRQLCLAGFKKRYGNNVPKSYLDRLNYELKVIIEMNYQDYFLIVWDIILYARRNSIYVGPGRGSAAGSLVSYCLGITHIDPMKYDLLFERFLNPERISMPDIDIDIPDDKREQLIDYVASKYGQDCVAHIITFSTLAARAVIRDASKALNVSAYQVDILLKNLPKDLKIDLKTAYRTSKSFKQIVDSSDDLIHLMNIAVKLEGLPRNISTNAAGVVLSNRQLVHTVPLIRNGNVLCTQYPNTYLEELGLIKMDFLALKNLTTIDGISQFVKQHYDPDFDIMKISLNDPKVYDLLCKGKTSGIFQLESEGMTSLICKLQPKCFDDIVIALALFRPGAIGNIDLFLEARNHGGDVHYPHPDLKPILRSTYGVMVYQEQIMQCAVKIAGFSLGKADILRKAMSKKKADIMSSLRKEFIDGAIGNGYGAKIGEEVYNTIEKFASYGFNKSHSVAYGLVAYQMAYLKANYPLPFYNYLLNSVSGAATKTNEYMVDCRKNHIRILPPDINMSDTCYTIETNDLRFPLTSIKGIGTLTATAIINERKENGIYKDYTQCICRLYACKTDIKTMTSLIRSGCMDCFKLSRTTMVNNLENRIKFAKLNSRYEGEQLVFDFGMVMDVPNIVHFKDDISINQQDEYELIGFYLNGHPAETYRPKYPKSVSSAIALSRKGYVELITLVQKSKEIKTKTGQQMCFVTAYDEAGSISLTFMPKEYSRYRDLLEKGNVLLVHGKVDDRASVLVNDITVLNPRKETA